jgi:hypothetical protein
VSEGGPASKSHWHWIWPGAFIAVAVYVAARMGALTLWSDVPTETGVVSLPNTFASVDHPFHVARADTLWRELTRLSWPRWIGQHQGGYPVEFYPLGAAWLEVAIRALSLGRLPAEGAHTLAAIVLFLAPGIAYLSLAREDGWSPAVALLALGLHLSLPGGWYDGGYTELVQWGLITNVAGSVLALSVLAPLLRFVRTGDGRAGVVAAAVAAWAIFCNPRSLVGLAALGAGAWLAGRWHGSQVPFSLATARIAMVAAIGGLLAATQLVALLRFGDLYAFVRYSGYDAVGDYAATAVRAVSWPVILLAAAGLALGVIDRRPATRAAALALVCYVVLTGAVAFGPVAASLAPQLEPTRLMPLQRFLTIYLAAVASWALLEWLSARVAPRQTWVASATAIVVVAAMLIALTRPLPGPPPDPASTVIPAVGLYPVVTSARPEQIAFEAAIHAADTAAAPGTALLVLGSALSWHQPLWAPLWTTRPLVYDNWLWSWRPDRAGTPGYRFAAGNHYPDPERTLDRDYLDRHGIGAVVVTGAVQEAARTAPGLRPISDGLYSVFAVVDPTTIITFDGQNAATSTLHNQRLIADPASASAVATARTNWHPRWEATAGDRPAIITLRDDGFMDVTGNAAARLELRYVTQPLDWAARVLVVAGMVLAVCLATTRRIGGLRFSLRRPGADPLGGNA